MFEGRINSLPDGCNRIDEPWSRGHLYDENHHKISAYEEDPVLLYKEEILMQNFLEEEMAFLVKKR